MTYSNHAFIPLIISFIHPFTYAQSTETISYSTPSSYPDYEYIQAPAESNKLLLVLTTISAVMLLIVLFVTYRFGKAAVINSTNMWDMSREVSNPNGQNDQASMHPDMYRETTVMVLDPTGLETVSVRVIKAGDEGWWIPNENGVNAIMEKYLEPLPTYTVTNTSNSSRPSSIYNLVRRISAGTLRSLNEDVNVTIRRSMIMTASPIQSIRSVSSTTTESSTIQQIPASHQIQPPPPAYST